MESASFEKQLDKDEYENIQIARHLKKRTKKRNRKFYEGVADIVITLDSKLRFRAQAPKDEDATMLCMGTRNNWERNCFSLFLQNNMRRNIKVFSNDISPKSEADFVFDFQNPPKSQYSKWDIIYTNAIDHAQSATDAFYNWLPMLKEEGLLVIGFCCTDGVPTKHDLCMFDQETLSDFFNNHEKVQVLGSASGGSLGEYIHYFLRKLPGC